MLLQLNKSKNATMQTACQPFLGTCCCYPDVHLSQFTCSYLFHYISEDRVIYLCITDDVRHQPFFVFLNDWSSTEQCWRWSDLAVRPSDYFDLSIPNSHHVKSLDGTLCSKLSLLRKVTNWYSQKLNFPELVGSPKTVWIIQSLDNEEERIHIQYLVISRKSWNKI